MQFKVTHLVEDPSGTVGYTLEVEAIDSGGALRRALCFVWPWWPWEDVQESPNDKSRTIRYQNDKHTFKVVD